MLAITDFRGNFLTQDDGVIFTYDNHLYVGRVLKVCPKSVKVISNIDGVNRKLTIPNRKFVKTEYLHGC